MGSVAFAGEDESQPSTSNGKKYKLPRTLLDGCGAVNHASVPRKLRSAVKKRGRESVTSPLPISRKQHRVSNGVGTLRKDGAKKSKLNTKQGHITKDEEEVAETLYALAGMFSDANKADQPGLDDELPEKKSSAILEDSSINAAEDTCLTLREDSRKIISKVTLEAACHSSNLVDSTAQVVKFQSLGVQQPEFFSSEQPATPSAPGVQPGLCLVSRPRVSVLGITPRVEQEIDLEQVTASGVQYGKNYNSMNDKYKDLFLSPNLSATRALSSETERSCPSARLPAWFESTSFSSQRHVIENSIITEKHTRVAVESKKSWKRCSAHVYISRLIEVLQISDRKEGLPEKPTQLTTCGSAELQPRVSTHNQITGINGRNGGASFSGIDDSAVQKDSSEIQNDILLHKRPIQDQQMASETSALCSAKQGYDFLSLGTGLCGLDADESVNRAGRSHEPSQQFHMSYMLSQNHSPMLFSLPQNGYSSTFQCHNSALAAQQVQLPQYHSGTVSRSFTARTGQQLESQQLKWAAQLQTHYNTGGGGAPRFPDWKNGGRDSASVLNYAHALFPHLHAALGSKYQQFSPQQQQVMAINSSLSLSNMKRHHHHHHLPLGLERNGSAFHSESIPQLQLPCNQHL